MSQISRVLVTGISGYLGSHVVDQLVRQGYRVTGTIRSAKLATSREAFKKAHGDAVELVALNDLVKDSYADALKGVDAVIHVAAPPVGGAASAAVQIDAAVDGCLNIFRQAEKAGVKHFGYISSIITYDDLSVEHGKILGDDEWISINKEDVLNNKNAGFWQIYSAVKVLAEKAVWDFADAHPHIEVTCVNPAFVYGPFAPGFTGPYEGDVLNPNSLSSMAIFRKLIDPQGTAPRTLFVDARDIARVLVAGLQAPPTTQVGRKRFLLASVPRPQPSEIVNLLLKERPELAKRINEATKNAADDLKPLLDEKRLKEVLGIELTPWQSTILDGVDAIVKLEDEWKSRGAPIYP
ncbi:hypothetical protein EIP91_011934 [Steccherinum ochraceum]|uniref:NAD-dependent epimerase/dehydratase domain-containing protein n=1 Tax=Steccherinum ochraceum TaxID=92696 RepID=A0A4R0RJX4_9APHY|nr:hypothetical protein EIP91_011934 [Steccherinum ochraceum]